jgi:phenylacetate-coenzyme A ligase PaaK-like adenylate-forming protein
MKENNSQDIESLIKTSQYSLLTKDKDMLLLKTIKKQLEKATINIHIQKMFKNLDIDICDLNNLADIPYIPVQMFKLFDLKTCAGEDIVRVLKSSGTTGKKQSQIPLSKKTVINQTKALTSILSNYLGSKRKIFLVIDHEGMNKEGKSLTARSAGIRGLSIFAKKIFYLLEEDETGKLQLNKKVINELVNNYENEDVYVFGFTFIIWSQFYQKIKEMNIDFRFKGVKLFHSGGWKKLLLQAVSKDVFSREIAQVFNTNKENVFDFYGMAEQTGIIFVDCEYGNKHVPNFAKVIIRDVITQKPCEIGQKGMIEVMSILSDSYYDQAILTEDLGSLVGIDDCPCGRKGEYFRFVKRIEKAEVRGCGDTFKEKNENIFS